ncbi:MAG: flagellar hook-length control protein FliK [Deltaproteobacteria bacterium]|nr:flagellar hook-length control protein FliK [Deltaproteobacteria bacterium]
MSTLAPIAGRPFLVADPGRLPFAPVAGTVLEAVVLRGLSDGRVALQIGETVVMAATSLPLEAGQHLSVEVAHATPFVLLRLLPDTAASDALPGLLPSASGGEAWAALLDVATARSDDPGLRGLAALLVLPEQEAGDPEALRAFIQRSGLFFEARLQRSLEGGASPPAIAQDDVKGWLLRLLGELAQSRQSPDGGGGDRIERLRSVLDQALQNLEVRQLAARGSGERGLLFYLPLQLDESSHLARLVIRREPNRRRRARERGVQIRLALEPQALGPLRLEVALTGKRLRAAFGAARAEVVAFMEGLLPELADRLAALGYQVEQLQAHRLPEAALRPEAEEWAWLRRGVRGLDVRI